MPSRRMDLEDLTHVRMADSARRSNLRRKPAAKAGLGALNSDPAVQPFILGFVDDAHTALSHLAHDAEASFEQISGHDRMVQVEGAAQRVEKEPIHALLPLHIFPGL